MQNPNPLHLTFRDVKKFDMQNPIIGKIATQIKASKLTEDQLTKKNLIQDEIYKIENRLEKWKRPIKMDSDSDYDGGTGSGGGGGSGDGDDGLPPAPGRPSWPRYYKPHPPPASCPPTYATLTYPVIPTPSELQFLRSKDTVRRSDIPILPDTPPPTRIKDDYFPLHLII